MKINKNQATRILACIGAGILVISSIWSYRCYVKEYKLGTENQKIEESSKSQKVPIEVHDDIRDYLKTFETEKMKIDYYRGSKEVSIDINTNEQFYVLDQSEDYRMKFKKMISYCQEKLDKYDMSVYLEVRDAQGDIVYNTLDDGTLVMMK